MAFTIWVMEDYGKESWTKFMEIPSKVLPPVQLIVPASISENGEVLMSSDQKTLVLYNREEKTLWIVFKNESDSLMLPNPVTYVETLVSPKTGRVPGGEQTSETNLEMQEYSRL